MSRNQSQPLCLFHFERLIRFSLSLSTARLSPRFSCCLRGFVILFLIAISVSAHAQDENDSVHAGFLFDRHELTLIPGEQIQAAGPFFYRTDSEFEDIFALPPFFSRSTIEATDSEEYDFLYPLLTYDRYGLEYRWQICQLFNFSGGQTQDEDLRKRFTLFPIYFQQRGDDPGDNYTAVFPIYGEVRNRMFRSRIEFILWPMYVKTVKRGRNSPLPSDPFLAARYQRLESRRGEVTTYNYFYPFFHLRYGEGLKGWQFWPFVGREHKDITTKTNDWGDLETTYGFDKRFILWPFYAEQEREIGSKNPEHDFLLFPFYHSFRSPARDSTSYFLVTVTDDRGRKYREVDAPWPLIVFARGEGKTANRVWPFYGRAYNNSLESTFFLWPLYKYNGINGETLDRDRTRILLFLYQHVRDKNLETGKYRSRTDLWPFFVHHHELDGTSRLQVLALLESLLPMSKSIERNYSPLWSVWRSENNPATGKKSQSLLWNLYRRETTPTTRKGSLFFGLFQYESNAESKHWRLFYLPLKKSQKSPDHVSEHR